MHKTCNGICSNVCTRLLTVFLASSAAYYLITMHGNMTRVKGIDIMTCDMNMVIAMVTRWCGKRRNDNRGN